MKAILIQKTGSVDNIEVSDLPQPGKLKSGEVRLKFLAGSLNHLDLWVLKGLPRVTYQFPHILGADLCAEVLESKSKKFKRGQRVVLYPAKSQGKELNGKPAPENLCSDFHIRGENTSGVFAEETIAHKKFIFLAPKHLSNAEAAAMPLVYLTAWQMVYEKAGLRPKQKFDGKILVHGAGSGVSQAILNLLLSFGLKKQIAITSRDLNKLSFWQKKGIQTFQFGSQTSDEIKNWAAGKTNEKVSIIFDHLGEKFFEMNIRLLKTGGKFITCGATTGFEGKIDLRHLYFRQLQLLGSTMGSLAHFKEMISWITKSKITPKIAAEFDFYHPKAGFALMEAAEQDGKIVFLRP
ncbi:MAG: zinc-binding dehydrogenase [Deltaproteobacteria bacterium]|nr:zinc-binding dehydrogenase [Deltaproteobacteria bacterium]